MTKGKAPRKRNRQRQNQENPHPKPSSLPRFLPWGTPGMLNGSAKAYLKGPTTNNKMDKDVRQRRGGRPISGTVAVLSAVCVALLLAGALSFSRSQVPAAGIGSNSTRRTSEAGGTVGEAGVGSATTTANRNNDASASRKLARRPELKTRGGKLAFARFTLLAEYPHDSAAFTQGLSYDGGYLYESTGLKGGKSSVRKVQPETGEVVKIVNLESKHFGEGMVILGDEIHSLTWRSRIGFTWDLQTFELKKDFTFTTKTGQGWGITTDGESLIVSDGSQFLFFWDPETMEETRRVEVITKDNRPVRHINELEMIKGYVFANVWFEDNIYKIDPATGDVVDTYSFQDLYPKALQKKEISSKEAVLNGIAWDPEEDVLYITGKLWPRMYKVKLHEEGEGEEGVIADVEAETEGTDDGGNARRRGQRHRQ